MKLLKIVLLSMLLSALSIVLIIAIFSLFTWIGETFGGSVAIIVSCFTFLTLIFSIGFYC